MATTSLTLPADGIEFDLTMSAVLSSIDMIRQSGVDPRRWQFKDRKIIVPKTERFKLVSVGKKKSFEALQAALRKKGLIPKGEWLYVLKDTFKWVDGGVSIAVADNRWIDQGGDSVFPYFPHINDNTRADFYAPLYGIHEHWRWLIKVRAR